MLQGFTADQIARPSSTRELYAARREVDIIAVIDSSRAASAGDGDMTSSIITVATMKGGSGKSTLASCLAVHWRRDGGNPVIIDTDPQRSIARLAAREKALGGVPVVEDASEDVGKTAQYLARGAGPVIIDTPGFRSQATLACIGVTDFVLVPVKPSPFDVDRMLDTLNILINGVSGRRPPFRCVLTQTTRDSVIAKHIRSELIEAGFPVLKSELINRVIYAEAALWGATPSLIEPLGPAAQDIAAIAGEVDDILAFRHAAVA
jgi:chromosome partitioning protein